MPVRYHKNVPAPFYVAADECMACGAPEVQAPDLMSHAVDGSQHCYFKRQPVTTAEWQQAFDAMNVACCGQICFTGDFGDVPNSIRAQFETSVHELRKTRRLGAWREARRVMMPAILGVSVIIGGFVALYFIIDFLLR